jgi:hypothetical protein
LTDKVPVSISKDIFDAIKKKVEAGVGGFSTVEEYIEFVLKELLADNPEGASKVDTITQEEEENLQKRLKKLGYE